MKIDINSRRRKIKKNKPSNKRQNIKSKKLDKKTTFKC